MFTEKGTLHLLKHISGAHFLFNFPLISRSGINGGHTFCVDDSRRYEIGALGILFLDVGSFFFTLACSWTTLVWKDEFDLLFRMLVIFFFIPLVLNVFFDIHSMLRKDEMEKNLNWGQTFYYSVTGRILCSIKPTVCLYQSEMFTINIFIYLLSYTAEYPIKPGEMKNFDNILNIVLTVGTISMGIFGIVFPLVYYPDAYTLFRIWNKPLHLPQSLLYLFVACAALYFCIITLLTCLKWEAYILLCFIIISTFKVSSRRFVTELGRADVASGDMRNIYSFYRQLSILTSLWNVTAKEHLFLARFTVTNFASLGFAIAVLHRLSPFSLLFLTFSSLLTFCLLFLFQQGGAITDTTSQPFRNAWKEALKKNPTATGLIGVKIGNSFRPCRIQAGTQYYLNRGVPFQILEEILNNAITIVLAFR